MKHYTSARPRWGGLIALQHGERGFDSLMAWLGALRSEERGFLDSGLRRNDKRMGLAGGDSGGRRRCGFAGAAAAPRPSPWCRHCGQQQAPAFRPRTGTAACPARPALQRRRGTSVSARHTGAGRYPVRRTAERDPSIARSGALQHGERGFDGLMAWLGALRSEERGFLDSGLRRIDERMGLAGGDSGGWWRQCGFAGAATAPRPCA